MNESVSHEPCRFHPDRVAGVFCQRCDAPICPGCMHPASVGYHCPECVRTDSRQQVRAQRAASRRAAAQHATPVVSALIAACVAIFLWDAYGQFVDGGPKWSTVELGVWAPLLDPGNEWYRALSYAFAHANFMHIGFNMWFLWALGPSFERTFGSTTFAATYVAGAIGGALGVLLIEPNTRAVGASGALFALMGATAVLQWMGGIPLFRGGIGGLVVINLLISFSGAVSLGGHLGGFVVGVAVGAILGLARRNGNQALAGAQVAIAALGLALALAVIPAAAWASPV